MQSLGLTTLYTTDEAVRLQVRQLMALGFAPRLLIRNIFRQLRSESNTSLLPLFTYFEQYWLTNIPISMWNVFESDLRTNNDCEGWHNRFNRAVGKHHPNIWHLLSCIRDEQATVMVTRQQIAAGHDMKIKSKKFLQMQKRIEKLYTSYNSGKIDVVQLITGISHNLTA